MSEKKEVVKKPDELQALVNTLSTQFGKGSIMKLGGDYVPEPMDSISTSCKALDDAIGIGGVPRGRIIEIFGPESSGKTTLTLHIIAEAHKAGGKAAFIDAEHALDVKYAQHLGVDTEKLLISQPDTGEIALEMTEALVRSGKMDVVVVDSVAALVPKSEIEGEMGDAQMGMQARLMSQAMRKLVGAVAASNTTLIFINQIRSKLGVVYGNPETTTGGNALKFYSSVRFDIRRISAIKQGETVVGNRTRVKIIKNKVGQPFKNVEFDIIYGEGIATEGDLVDEAVELGILTKSGTWFSYGEEKLGQGRQNVCNLLKSDPAFKAKLLKEIEDA